MKIIESHIVLHIERMMGTIDMNLRKVYVVDDGLGSNRYFLEKSSEITSLEEISREEFDKMHNDSL